MMKERPWGKGTPTWTKDATANDSDKSFTVPTGKVRIPKLVVANITNTATVGTRNLIVAIVNSSGDVLWNSNVVSPTASQVAQLYIHFGVGLPINTTNVKRSILSLAASPNAGCIEGAPDIIMNAGDVLRVYDVAAVDAAADDLTVVLHYVEYDA